MLILCITEPFSLTTMTQYCSLWSTIMIYFTPTMHLSSYIYPSHLISGRGEQSKGGRGAHGFGNEGQEALEAEKDPASAAPATEEAAAGEEVPAEPVVEAEPEPGMSTSSNMKLAVHPFHHQTYSSFPHC